MKTKTLRILIAIIIVLATGLTATTVRLININKENKLVETPFEPEKEVIEKPEEEKESNQKPEEEKEELKEEAREEKPLEKAPPKDDKKEAIEPSKPKPPKKETPKKPQAPSQPSQPSGEVKKEPIVKPKYISRERAVEIARQRVGAGAKLIEVDVDLDDNPPTYEVEIISGNYEYEIEIHAITGAILDFDKDDLD